MHRWRERMKRWFRPMLLLSPFIGGAAYLAAHLAYVIWFARASGR